MSNTAVAPPSHSHDVNDAALWQAYIGRSQTREAVLDAAIIARFNATLGLSCFDGALPLGIHWCIGVDAVATGILGPDGHPPKGDFLPPVALPRRMWAGGALDILRPLYAGQTLRRISTVSDIREKSGRSGSLVFVTVDHEIEADGVLAIRERQDIVYRPADTGPAPMALAESPAMGEGPDWVMPDARLLFRYSALTFNSHRIHYDLPYAKGVENYPALVVHGPLQATLLADAAARRLGRPLTAFSFRGLAPAYADIALELRAIVPEPSEPAAEGTLVLESQQFSKACMRAEAR